jgi:hypothetical protein
MRTAIDLDEHIQPWLDDYGFQNSDALNFSLFLPQPIFWSAAASVFVLAIQW